MKHILLIGTLCAAPLFGAQNTVQLVSKEGAKTAPIARDLLLKPMVSGLTKTSLEHDKDETEITLPSVKSRELTKLKPVLEFIGNRVGTEAFDDLPATEQRDLVLAVGKALGGVKESEIADLIGAANYLDSRPLLEALLRRYAGFLGRHKQQVMARIRDKDKIPKDLWPAIAQSYFLLLGEDIPGYENIKIPVETLIAYGLIPEKILNEFPNFEHAPNEIRENRGWPYSALRFCVVFCPVEQVLTTIHAMRKINGIDFSADTNLLLSAVSRGLPIINALLDAGVKPDLIGGTGWTPLTQALFSGNESEARRLIEAGASFDTAKKALDSVLVGGSDQKKRAISLLDRIKSKPSQK